MLFCNIDILDENLSHRRNCYVGVKDQKIAYIGETMPEEDFGEHYDGSGRLLMTGFVNTHSHSAMTLMRGYGENLALSDWLNKRIFPFEAKLETKPSITTPCWRRRRCSDSASCPPRICITTFRPRPGQCRRAASR